MEEYLDILDEHGEKTGVKRTYDDAHKQGLLHRSVHIWFFNPSKGLLLQKRSSIKVAYPDHWDISAAGHISAGQTSLQAAQIETAEELGVTVDETTFRYLFTLEEHIVLNAGTYISNEFQDVYLVQTDIDPTTHFVANDEVSEIRWVELDIFKSWITGKGELMVPHNEEYEQLVSFLNH